MRVKFVSMGDLPTSQQLLFFSIALHSVADSARLAVSSLQTGETSASRGEVLVVLDEAVSAVSEAAHTLHHMSSRQQVVTLEDVLIWASVTQQADRHGHTATEREIAIANAIGQAIAGTRKDVH